ncbi:hypothetical protein CTAYLR_008404 [Chrysophaeum taylorii]|uniref:MICOS complex subunit MIC10 n=1 Tax=Chrysophaeum taylorii TaxID=2483200 RepID=A0AAD7UJF3_9STRA|nr:hypothetical protein CTAYLR_008404 [Chrysophaeum taylorii]
MDSTKMPSELIMSAKWDKLIERVLLNAGYGLFVGMAASFVLTRGFAYRFAMTTFGMGVGVGVACERSSADFRKEE